LKLGSSQAVVQACAFLRNIIVARLLSPQDYGIAATFAMTFYLMEMISNLGMETHLVQSEHGNEPRFQRTAHLLLTLRGLMNATFIFALAGPISSLFGVPQARWAFRVLALTSLFKGLNHLDTYRFQREMRFGPSVTVDVSSNILVTLVALPLCWWYRSYTAMLWVLILQATTAMVLSHIVAERRYGRRILDFGWPLLINGLLMYGIFQGDRFVIGAAHQIFGRSSLTLADLGVYSVAFSLNMAPGTFVATVFGTLFLPHLAGVQKLRAQFERRFFGVSQIIALVAAVICIPFIVAGGTLVTLIYGHKYAAVVGFMGWLAAMWALRIIRVAPTMTALALGDTRNSMWSNAARTVALAGVLLVASRGGGLSAIAICGLVGEVLALAVCLWRLQRQHGVPASLCLRPSAVAGAGMLVAGLAAGAGVIHWGWMLSFPVAAALVLLHALVMVAAFPDLRRTVTSLVLKARLRLAPETASA